MAIRPTTTLFNRLPETSQKKYVYKVSTKVVSVKHAPEGTNPTNMEEFLKVAKQYWEFGVDVRQRTGYANMIFPYRCLFSSQKQAEEARSKMEQEKTNRDLKIAMEEYKKSKWKDEVEKWGDDITEEDEGDTNENSF